jgi:hypothetical protein
MKMALNGNEKPFTQICRARAAGVASQHRGGLVQDFVVRAARQKQ